MNKSDDVTSGDILDFLNSGGSYQALLPLEKKKSPPVLFHNDLTGDGVSEIIFVHLSLYVLGCQNENYVILMQELPSVYPWKIDRIQDFNHNGLPEIVGLNGFPHGESITIYEWDGTTFQKRMEEVRTSLHIDFQDIDNDGRVEIILTATASSDFDVFENGPYQQYTTIYRWDGKLYAPYRATYQPVYRFEAVQDGDRSVKLGDYAYAFQLYQRVIHDGGLKPWSEAISLNIRDQFNYYRWKELTPTPVPPDLDEAPILAAYARYRILLLDLLQGKIGEAKLMLAELNKTASPGTPGNGFAELATKFWNMYEQTGQMSAACQQTIQSIPGIWDLMHYLGNTSSSSYHGYWSLDYSPEDICPYK
jgi:hypothetical protein